MADKPYTLCFRQQVSAPVAEVFDFFSRAENLEALTPPWLKFKTLDAKPQPLINTDNTDNTDQEKPTPLQHGGTEEAEAARRKARHAADFADER